MVRLLWFEGSWAGWRNRSQGDSGNGKRSLAGINGQDCERTCRRLHSMFQKCRRKALKIKYKIIILARDGSEFLLAPQESPEGHLETPQHEG